MQHIYYYFLLILTPCCLTHCESTNSTNSSSTNLLGNQDANQTSRALLSSYIQQRFYDVCPAAAAKNLLLELSLRQQLAGPMKLNIVLLLYRLHEVNDLSKTLTVFALVEIAWRYPCPPLTVKQVPELERVPQELVQFSRNLSEIWYPLVHHANTLTDVEIIPSLTSTLDIFPSIDPPFAIATGLTILKSSCGGENGFSFDKFPFDTVNCQIRIQAWEGARYVVFEQGMINYAIEPAFTFIDDDDIWSLNKPVNFTIEESTDSYGVAFQSCLFSLNLKRKYTYYVGNVFVPMIALYLLQVASLLMDPSQANRPCFCITVVLAIFVLLNLIFGLIPRTSHVVYLILIIEGKMTIAAVITIYSLIACTIAGSKWAKRLTCRGCYPIRVIRALDWCVAMASIIASGLLYIYCLPEMLSE